MAMARFNLACSARFNDVQHTSPQTVKSTSNTLELLAWQTKTTSAVAIKRNPVPLIAPLFSFSGARWWIPLEKWWKRFRASEEFREMDYLIPTINKDRTGFIPRPGTPDRSLRWLKDALGKQGAPAKDVAELSWYSFRVFMPDCAFQAHIPRDQRQYLGNWFKESTADVYTREKRHVVCSIWDQVLQKLPFMQLEAGRAVRVDFGHEDWEDKVECPASPKALFKEVPDTPPSNASWDVIPADKPAITKVAADEVPPPRGPLMIATMARKEERPRDDHQPMHGQSPGAEGPERDPRSTNLPPRAERPERDDGDLRRLGRLSGVGTLREGVTPRCRGALIGGPHSPPGTKRPGGSRGGKCSRKTGNTRWPASRTGGGSTEWARTAWPRHNCTGEERHPWCSDSCTTSSLRWTGI